MATLKLALLSLIALPLILSPAGIAGDTEEISVDVSDLESNPEIMKKYDVDNNGELSNSELGAYIAWLESGGDDTVEVVEGTSWVFVKNGKPIRYWRPPPPALRPHPYKKPLPPKPRRARPWRRPPPP